MSHLRKKTDLRQSQPINSNRKQWQPGEDQALYKKSLELEWFRTLYENIPCICFTLNSAGKVLAVSQFGAEYLGYSAAELTQKSITSVFYLEDKAKSKAKLTDLQQQPDGINQWEVRLVRKDGSIVWAKAIARLVPQIQPQPIMTLVFEDITDAKQRFEALQKSEDLHRITLNNMSDTVFITDNTGAFTFICPNVEVIFGYSWQETMEMGNLAKLLGEELFDWQELERVQEIQNIEREVTDKTGRRHTLLVNVKRVSIDGGTILYSCRDISDRKRVEDELQQYHHHLERRVEERTAQLVRANAQLQQEITERKRVEEALRESESRFRYIIDSNLIGFFFSNYSGIITEANKAFLQLVGYTREELLASKLRWDTLTPPEYQPLDEQAIQELRRRGACIPYEKEYICKDGSRVPIMLAAACFEDEREMGNSFAFVLNLTEQKQVESALRNSEKRFRLLTENSTDMISQHTSEGIFLYASPACRTLLGYEPEDLLGHSVYEFFHADDLAELRNSHTTIVELPTTYKVAYRIRRKDGGYIWFETISRTIRNPETGDVLEIQCASRDITDRKQVEEALRLSETRFRAAVEGSLDAFYILQAVRDEAGRIEDFTFVDLNTRGEKLISMSKQEVIGKRLCKLLPINRTGGFFEKYVRVVERGEVIEEEFPIRTPKVNAAWLHHQVVPLVDGVAITTRDITERKRAEDALRENASRLKLALEAAKMGTWDWNIANNQLVCSEQLGPVLGLPSGTCYPSHDAFLNSVYWEDREYVERSLRCAIEEGADYRVEFRVLWPDGTLHWVGNKGQVYRDGTGKPMRMVGVAMNITERKQAEVALQQQYVKERLVGAIAQRIHQSLNLEEILNITVAEVRQFLACDRVIIFRLNPDGSGVVVVESVGSDWMSIAGTIIDDRYFAESYIQLYQQGRVQAVEDIYNASLAQCHIELLAQFQVRANLVVPIVHEEALWGLLVAQQCSETRQWQLLEIDLLKSLSTQAAIAIQQSELYQQAQIEILQRQQAEDALRQQVQRERLVGAISQRIRRSLKLENILNATVAEVRQVLQTDRVIIFRFEPDWSGNVVVESVNSNCLSILGKNIFDPCFKKCYVVPYQQGRIRAIEDIYTANLSQCHIKLLEKLQVRANLVVPILKHQQLWGLLVAHHCTQTRQWQQGEIDLLLALAAQAGIAIQHSQLYERVKSHFSREQLLNQLTQAIRSSLDLDTIFATAVSKIGEVLQVDRAQICQYLPKRKCWLNVSEYRESSDLPVALGVEIPDENNEITAQLKRLEIVKIDDADTCEDEINKSYAHTFPGAWLLVPLHFGDAVWGSLGLVKHTRPYQWQDWEVELIRAVGDQVAIAIQQAELYQQSRTATAQALTQAQQLEQALVQLQKTQAQLVQSEKMSSLGQLVAGVAHEINNPVSFIYGNLVHASGYTTDLLHLIELYQEHYPNPVPEIESEIEAIDLEFLMEDLPKLLFSMKVGAERICEIVAALRTFSRLAEAEVKAVNLHEGLDSTLMILQNRLKASGKHPEIKVIREYGNLPLVQCYAGQLNQVFMNLLVNAIDAIDEYNQMRSPEEIQDNPSFIRVRTELLNNSEVAIRIADNGPGMTEEVKVRLFDPFFTTKPVGTGTGLGLSISYQIVVEKHRGQLHCYSELGQGTEFVIQIPLSQGGKD